MTTNIKINEDGTISPIDPTKPSSYSTAPKPNTTNIKAQPEEPTIDWLIDYLVPNEGSSPLIEFNKNRLKALIASKVREAQEEMLNDLPWCDEDHHTSSTVKHGKTIKVSENLYESHLATPDQALSNITKETPE